MKQFISILVAGLMLPAAWAAGQAAESPASDSPTISDSPGKKVEREGERNKDAVRRGEREGDARGGPERSRFGRPEAIGPRGERRDGFGPPFRPRGGDGEGWRPDGEGPPRPGGPDEPPPRMGPPFLRGELLRQEELKKIDPEMYELEKNDRDLERQTLELGQQYRRAPRDERIALKKQLDVAVQQHFEARQARRQLQLKRLEEELERMRSALKRRTELRSQIVERRVLELIGEEHELDF
jgi:hypothetical protein